MMFLFEGGNIVRRGPHQQTSEAVLCEHCPRSAEYTLHGPDESEELCCFHLAHFLCSVTNSLLWQALEAEGGV